jgi:hypothetical protein
MAAFTILAVGGAAFARGEDRVFRPEDFGAVAGDEINDQPAMAKAIEAAGRAGPGAVVQLSEGEYRIGAPVEDKPCLTLSHLKGVKVRGAGYATRLTVTAPRSKAFFLDHCEDTWIERLSVDFDPLPFTQGEVVAVDLEDGWFDVRLDRGYPSLAEPRFTGERRRGSNWGTIMNRAGKRLKDGAQTFVAYKNNIESVGEGVWRLFTPNNNHRLRLKDMETGDGFVATIRAGGGFSFNRCAGGGVREVTLHTAGAGAATIIGSTARVTLRRFRVVFPENSKRMLTTCADGVHCQQNRVGPLIENCEFEGMADDAVNIYCPPNVLTEIISPTVWRVTAKTESRPGDRFQVLDPISGRVRAIVKAAKIENVGNKAAFYDLTIEQPVDGAVAGKDHRFGDTLYNLDACGSGFVIRGNHFRPNRRYGVLLRAHGGIVENNIFERNSGDGLIITNEPDWPEGPMPGDIVIRGNTFISPGGSRGFADSTDHGALTVRARRLGGKDAQGRPIARVTIEDNDFIDCLGAAINIAGTRDVRITNNRIVSDPNAPRHRPGAAVVLDNSRAMTVEDLTVEDLRPETKAALQIGPAVGPGDDGVKITGLKARLGASAEQTRDLRK